MISWRNVQKQTQSIVGLISSNQAMRVAWENSKVQILNFSDLDILGITDDKKCISNLWMRYKILKTMLKNVVKLPMKETRPLLSNNYYVSLKRLDILKMRSKGKFIEY